MGRVFLLIGISFLFVLSSCKYEEGPAISLKSKEKRLIGNWEVSKLLSENYKDIKYEVIEMEFKENNNFILSNILVDTVSYSDTTKEKIISSITIDSNYTTKDIYRDSLTSIDTILNIIVDTIYTDTIITDTIVNNTTYDSLFVEVLDSSYQELSETIDTLYKDTIVDVSSGVTNKIIQKGKWEFSDDMEKIFISDLNNSFDESSLKMDSIILYPVSGMTFKILQLKNDEIQFYIEKLPDVKLKKK